ncbi:M23 family metallopeptidase [Algoriphagus boritolerans]|uniref:Murein DD-endopeptidase MepM and murein hydrolase activator NlpD, contain LysM domain n=1 Tax=Algoriphagus boritolerans DSM 17298 = JCM 18970 TaxID=1120964 RepID=A0A1H5URU9_9BACT|nr:M23 family metallopeptidase [Algoriphagus boritolerans]SEF77694.1 Murein DD-endopeptidase MepM and murein hydrolase activator NlpD, contain LysM domain [Algoriphagus boritolerans DSM 17298 = JCM 18970]
MLKIFISLVVLIFSFSSLSAQITIETERDSDGNVLLFAVNPTKVPYSVILNFSQLQNMTTPGGGNVTAIASPGRSKVATLKPTLAGQGTNYRYAYSFAKGNVYGKTKIDPIYLIPVAEGTPVKAVLNNNISNTLNKDEKDNSYVGISFIFEQPTLIVAPRKGVVAEMKMDYATDKENLNFSAEENYMEIYHEDGTITKLTVLKSGSAKVEVGDQVLPGQVLAESAGDNYQHGPHVRMVNQRTEKNGPDKLKYTYFPVVFATEEGNIEIKELSDFTVTHPKEIITRELNKKELKSFQSGN